MGLRKRFVLFAVAGALIGTLIGVGASPAGAAIISASDVSAGITVPGSASGPFEVTGTITNSGAFGQDPGSKLIISASGGAVTTAPADCPITSGVATCTVGALAPGASVSRNVKVTPNNAAASVTTTASVVAANGELNILPDNANNTASGATTVLYSVSVSGISRPDTVRNGDDTLLTASVTNGGVGQNISLTVDTGNVFDPALALPAGCASANGGAKVVCTATYLPNETKSFDVAIVSLPTGSSMTTGLSVAGTSGGNAAANVVTNLFADATAFVPQGKSLSDTEPKLTQKFSVPTGSAPGLFLDLNQAVIPPGTMCGTSLCANYGAEALFPGTGTYSGNDPAHPFLWDINFGKLNCNGGGAPKCTDILYVILSGQTTPVRLEKCASFGQATAYLVNVDQVCLQNVVKNAPGVWTFTVALLRDIVIPPIGGVVSGSNG
jgi:hypothetical protein